MRYLLARCQVAGWAYQEWLDGGPPPQMSDAFFAALSLAWGRWIV